jgi:hypothetical protein
VLNRISMGVAARLTLSGVVSREFAIRYHPFHPYLDTTRAVLRALQFRTGLDVH